MVVTLVRDIDAATLAAMDDHFHPILAVNLDWPVTPIFAHSSLGSISWGGDTYEGVGKFGDVAIPADGFGIVPTSATVALLGVPSSVLAILDDDIRGRDGFISFGLTTEAGGNVLVGDLNPLFAGYMDTMAYSGARTREGTKEVIDHRIDIGLSTGPSMRSSVRLAHSYEDQIEEFPGDTAGRHLQWATTTARKRKWPA